MNDRAWKACSALLVALNLLDAACTLEALRRGALEQNPLQAAALAVSPAFFVASKVAVACGAAWVFWKSRSALARAGLVGACAFYALVGAYHLALLS